MNDYFPDNFVDYDDPPLGSDEINSDNRDFSLTSPNSDSTGLFPLSSFSPQVQTTFPLNEQLNFDLMNYYNQQQEQKEAPIQQEVPESSKKGSRSKKAKAPAVTTPTYTENSTDSASEGKILDKSKRIQKREIAKERTKAKTDLATMFQGVDTKFLPEGYDDPNLDERTKKKMIQMVRNRISAQNSRDRKKGYMSSLEEQNNQLEAELAQVREERDALARELQSAQEEIQFLRNGGAGACQNCQSQVKDEDFLVTNNGENNEHDNIPAGGFSGLSSPRLVRFASSKGSLFGMFAFTALVAMVAFTSVGDQNMGVMSGNGLTQMSQTRMLDVQPFNPATESLLKTKVDFINVSLPDYSKSVLLENIHQIKTNFERSYEPVFKSHLEKSNILNVTVHDKILEPIVKEEVQNGLVEYRANKVPKLRRNLPITANTPPALNSMINDSLTSTLFCSSGQEFYDNGNQNVHITNKSNLAKNHSLDIEKAEYLQLLVPKGTIRRHNINNNLHDIYGQELYADETSDDTMLEIWCKVFQVREIGTSY